MPLRQLPPSFVRNVSGAFPEGARWLDQLPETLEACLKKWNLTLAGAPFDLSYHYVVPVLNPEGTSAVLKLGIPSPGQAAEARALTAFAGIGTVRLLDHDRAMGALLLERVAPGNTLASLHDENQATAIAAQIMTKLWQAPLTKPEFPSLDSWTIGFDHLRNRYSGATCPLDLELVGIAERIRAELLQSTETTRLLHADLHHFNILNGKESGWVAIDPKGVIGDPAYEPASFLLNPDSTVFLNPSMQQARIATLACNLDMDAQRITRWAFVHAVLAAWWTLEDGGVDYDSSIDAARVLLLLLN